MNKIKNIFALTLLTGLLTLTSCNPAKELIKSNVKATIEITSNNENGQVIDADDVIVTSSLYDVELDTTTGRHLMPSTGNVNLLIIPMIMPGYETIDIDKDGNDDKEKVREDIKESFFGTSDNLGYESVSDFYYQSSFGKLNLNGYVTPWFDVTSLKLGYKNAAEIDYNDTFEIIEGAIKWVKRSNFVDLTKYDNDKDGYIDGVWCIYSCPNFTNGGPKTENNNYWAYTSWGRVDESKVDVKSPVASCFGWASYDFMYDGYGLNKIDSHTYIHETGHFMGLNDYYGDSNSYNPIGKVDMMDGNIIDHNSFSKMLLGWSKPTIVTGNATIEISSLINENSFIIIPSDDTVIENNEFNPWDEYILIDLYTNEANNYKDSRVNIKDRPLAPSSYGVRIYHVDRRMFYADLTDDYNYYIKEYEGEEVGLKQRLAFPITNYRESDVYNFLLGLDSTYNLYDELRLIEANNIDTFSNGGYLKDKSLFKTGDTFSLEKYASFFDNGLLNNSKELSATVKIGGIK